jgi:pyruvate dehydrogenase E1 component alpha subunit
MKKKEIENLLYLRLGNHIINELLKKKLFKIPIHLGFGHEALALALINNMSKNDVLCLTHRNFTYNLAVDLNLNKIINHFFLKTTTKSKNNISEIGSMNLINKKFNILYTSSILGNNLSVGSGIALNKKVSKKNGKVFIVTGDGAIEEGAFWESLVFIKSLDLDVVILIENNNYSMSSEIKERRCNINLYKIAKALQLEFLKLDNNEYSNINRLLSHKLNNRKPLIIEANIKTFNHHVGPTPGWQNDRMNINITNGLIVEQSKDDPIYNLHKKISTAIYEKISKFVIKKYSSYLKI